MFNVCAQKMFVGKVKILIFILTIWKSLCFEEDIASFRIISPQIICPTEENNATDLNSSKTTISFQPLDGMRLSYKFRIFFTSFQQLTQRETLLVWKSIRALENRINSRERLKISKENVFFISKSEIIPDITYTFHVIGITDAGVSSQEKMFTFTYLHEILENVPLQGNILLIGSEIATAGTPYFIYAKVSFCKPKFDYYLRWNIFQKDQNLQELLLSGSSSSSKNFKIPPNVLQTGSEYKIQAAVLESNSSKILIKESINIKVLKRGFEAYIIPTSIRIGLNKPATFQLFIRDYDNIFDKIQVVWEYTPLNYVSRYTAGIALSKTRFEIVFREQGRYKVTATLKLNAIEKKVTADVEIDANIFSSYEFEQIPNIEIAARQELKFTVLVNNLIPYCKMGWSSAQEDGFVYINQDELNFEMFEQTKIKDLERLYLSEIVDFENSTVNREIALHIPPALSKKDNWKGFEGDANYKFRLDTICPRPYSYMPRVGDNRDATNVAISHYEFAIHTNSPPDGGKLEIHPDTGTALQTIFLLSTKSGKDIFLDNPLTYEFCANIETHHICFNKFCDYKSLETKLPYTSEPIHLTVIICDVRQACSTFSGPKTTISYSEMTPIEFTNQIIEIEEAFKRSDFLEASNLILMAAITYKNGASKLLDQFKNFTKHLLKKEINKMLERSVEKSYLSREEILQFVTLTKRNLDILPITNENIFLKLLEIIEQITSYDQDLVQQSDPMPGSISGSLEFSPERFRRQSEMADQDNGQWQNMQSESVHSEYFRVYLQLLESIYGLNSEQTNKFNITSKINDLAVRMCLSKSIIKEKIVSNIAFISIEKFTGNYILSKEFRIENYTSQSGFFKINIPELKSRIRKYCIIFIQYPKDYKTTQPIPSNYVDIIDLQTHKSFQNNYFENSTISKNNARNIFVLAINKNKKDQNMCFLNRNDRWSPNFCSVKYISSSIICCECSRLGHIRLGTIELPAATTENIIHFPDHNRIHTEKVKMTGTESNHIDKHPVTSATYPFLLQVPLIANTVPFFGNDTSLTPQQNDAGILVKSTTARKFENELKSKKIHKASALVYTLPILFIIAISLLLFFLIKYYRNRTSQNKSLHLEPNWSMEYRQRTTGIKYANFHDEHTMSGNFYDIKIYKPV